MEMLFDTDAGNEFLDIVPEEQATEAWKLKHLPVRERALTETAHPGQAP